MHSNQHPTLSGMNTFANTAISFTHRYPDEDMREAEQTQPDGVPECVQGLVQVRPSSYHHYSDVVATPAKHPHSMPPTFSESPNARSKTVTTAAGPDTHGVSGTLVDAVDIEWRDLCSP